MRIRYLILWKKVQRLKIKYAKITAKIARLRRECTDSDERIKGMRKLVEDLRKEAQFKDEDLRKEAQFKDEVYKAQQEELKRLREGKLRYGSRSSL